jgi:hypothetical protein
MNGMPWIHGKTAAEINAEYERRFPRVAREFARCKERIDAWFERMAAMNGMSVVIMARGTEGEWRWATDDRGLTYWSDPHGHFSVSDEFGKQIPDSECFTTLEGKVIPFTENGAVTQEAWWEVERHWLAFEKAREELLAEMEAERCAPALLTA